MTVLNVAEQGLKYLFACLNLYTENCAFPMLYFAALIFLCVRGNEEERRLFLPGAVVMLLTIYNPISPVILMHFFDVNSEYYRFFWITPVIVLVPYVSARLILMQETGKGKAVFAILLALLFVLSGNFLYANGYERAENGYKMPAELIEISGIIHADADDVYSKAFLEYDYNMQMRQYDPKILLTIDREDYMNANQYDYSPEMLEDEDHPQYRILAALVRFQDVEPGKFAEALEKTHTEYVVLNKAHPMLSYLSEAGLRQIGETGERVVYKYDLAEPYHFDLVDYSVVY